MFSQEFFEASFEIAAAKAWESIEKNVCRDVSFGYNCKNTI